MQDLKGFLDEKVEKYNQPGFITLDPISIPHRFSFVICERFIEESMKRYCCHEVIEKIRKTIKTII
jgi:hypothetical protein